MSTGNKFLDEYYDLVNALDLEGIIAHHTDDTVAIMGNNPEIHGKDGMRAGFAGLFSALTKMEHDVRAVWAVDDGATILNEAVVTYHRVDGERITIPTATSIRLANGKVAKLHVYGDLAPVFEGLGG